MPRHFPPPWTVEALAGLNVSKHVACSKHCISQQQNGEARSGKRNFDMCVVLHTYQSSVFHYGLLHFVVGLCSACCRQRVSRRLVPLAPRQSMAGESGGAWEVDGPQIKVGATRRPPLLIPGKISGVSIYPLTANVPCTPHRAPADLAFGGSGHADTMNSYPTRAACFADLRDHAVRLMKRHG